MPESENNVSLANEFAQYFIAKIQAIRDDLKDWPLFDPPIRDCTELSAFRPLSENEVRKLIQQAKPTFCPTDPFPASLIKAHLDVFLPLMMNIVNNSLTSGIFSSVENVSCVSTIEKTGTSLSYCKL
ncbi:hypothetical protein HOLleu_10860 [Holothuria leucospilota]|uniref:Uncharacterized protein n=1 Tax=Holothuria leucospilota TaxID=206669 RepID=A0A9Q1HG20_HOLLE|nr:hypothetical protein HOLleu_10860 [Holothuria leucospilota]